MDEDAEEEEEDEEDEASHPEDSPSIWEAPGGTGKHDSRKLTAEKHGLVLLL